MVQVFGQRTIVASAPVQGSEDLDLEERDLADLQNVPCGLSAGINHLIA
jgi:hypothetical protein